MTGDRRRNVIWCLWWWYFLEVQPEWGSTWYVCLPTEAKSWLFNSSEINCLLADLLSFKLPPKVLKSFLSAEKLTHHLFYCCLIFFGTEGHFCLHPCCKTTGVAYVCNYPFLLFRNPDLLGWTRLVFFFFINHAAHTLLKRWLLFSMSNRMILILDPWIFFFFCCCCCCCSWSQNVCWTVWEHALFLF